ncbi:MAG: polysaccharide deacetylase family protein [Clostridiales bacterium]|nr:polysaccharide deacetylase family protein [Candidatus Blautia equi]
MKKRTMLLTSVLLCVSLFSGCALLPFEEDVPLTAKEEKEYIMPGESAQEESEEAEIEVVISEEIDELDELERLEREEESEAAEEPVLAHNEPADPKELENPDMEPEFQLSLTSVRAVYADAKILAAQYNYDAAIKLLENQREYEYSSAMKRAVKNFKKEKASCVEYPLEEITHVFFHTLTVDNSKVFDGDHDEAGYNQYMTTIPEFNKIIQTMYDKGYVMVSPHDMVKADKNGNMTRKKIMLPPGKIPFVLSQDDVSYYHYMEDDGFASRLVVTADKEVKCEYINDDGTVTVGDFDMVPLIDSFVKEHPDFSYHGRKGIIALTGYNGVLGYRTDVAYKTGENLYEDQRKFLEDHPDFDYDKEVKAAHRVAAYMKQTGWEFASHTWGHKNVTTSSLEELIADNERWVNTVRSVVGNTDMIIFAFGADIGNWEPYAEDNPKFQYYKKNGYNYFMNVDSSRVWVQITDRFFRQGRRNLDGYRMYYNPEMLDDLFDVADVWDSDRTVPVPPI